MFDEEKMEKIMKHISEIERRNFKIYCEDIIGDGENYILYFVVDGKVVKESDEGCFDNVLIDLYEFYRNCLDEYNYDDRFDSLKVEIKR